jgi:hypothetical protein
MFDLAHKYSGVIELPAYVLLRELERFVNGALIQIGRVERSKHRMYIAARKHSKFPTTSQARLFLDAHFYFVCLGQVDKFLGQMSRNLKSPALDEIHRRFKKDFEPEIRNDLEHLDERALGKQKNKDADPELVKKWHRDFVNFAGDELTFGGKMYPVNKQAAKRLSRSYRDIIAVIRQEYASKDVHFTTAELQQARIRRIIRQVDSKVKK